MPATFDPEVWDRMYQPRDGRGFVFQRGVQLAADICLELVRPGQRWLDLGCGTGRLLKQLAQADILAIGADHDARMMDFLQPRTPSPLARVQAEALPLGGATLDGVVATSLLGCVLQAGPVLSEIHRVLRPGGWAVITFTNRTSLLLRLNYTVARPDGQTYQAYEPGDVIQRLESLGFGSVRTQFYNFALQIGERLLPPRPAALRLEGWGRRGYGARWARNFIVAARKL